MFFRCQNLKGVLKAKILEKKDSPRKVMVILGRPGGMRRMPGREKEMGSEASQRQAEDFQGGWGGGGPPLGALNPPPTEGGAKRARSIATSLKN